MRYCIIIRLTSLKKHAKRKGNVYSLEYGLQCLHISIFEERIKNNDVHVSMTSTAQHAPYDGQQHK